MVDASHKTNFIGQFHPSQFEEDERGFYTAKMHGMFLFKIITLWKILKQLFTVKADDLQAVTQLAGHDIASQNGGISEIHNFRTYGGPLHSTQVGMIDGNGDFQPFQVQGHTAATIMPSGRILVGHHFGEDQGFTQGVNLKFNTENTHLPEDAASAMKKYSHVSLDDLKAQSFDSYQNLEVNDEKYALLPPGCHVRNIIDTHGKDPKFFGGAYSKDNHKVPESDQYLVPESHYNELYNPLLNAKSKTNSGFVIKATTEELPEEPIGYQFSLIHQAPTTAVASSNPMTAVPDKPDENILTALAKMGIKDAQIKPVVAAAAAGNYEQDE